MGFLRYFTVALGHQAAASPLLSPLSNLIGIGPRTSQDNSNSNATDGDEENGIIYERDSPDFSSIKNPHYKVCFESVYEVSLGRMGPFSEVTPISSLCTLNLGNMIPKIAGCVDNYHYVLDRGHRNQGMKSAWKLLRGLCEDAHLDVGNWTESLFVESARVPWLETKAARYYDSSLWKLFFDRHLELRPVDYDPKHEFLLARAAQPGTEELWSDYHFGDSESSSEVSTLVVPRFDFDVAPLDLEKWIKDAFLASGCAAHTTDYSEAAQCIAENHMGVTIDIAKQVAAHIKMWTPLTHVLDRELKKAHRYLERNVRSFGIDRLLVTRDTFVVAGHLASYNSVPQFYPMRWISRWDKSGFDKVPLWTSTTQGKPPPWWMPPRNPARGKPGEPGPGEPGPSDWWKPPQPPSHSVPEPPGHPPGDAPGQPPSNPTSNPPSNPPNDPPSDPPSDTPEPPPPPPPPRNSLADPEYELDTTYPVPEGAEIPETTRQVRFEGTEPDRIFHEDTITPDPAPKNWPKRPPPSSNPPSDPPSGPNPQPPSRPANPMPPTRPNPNPLFPPLRRCQTCVDAENRLRLKIKPSRMDGFKNVFRRKPPHPPRTLRSLLKFENWHSASLIKTASVLTIFPIIGAIVAFHLQRTLYQLDENPEGVMQDYKNLPMSDNLTQSLEYQTLQLAHGMKVSWDHFEEPLPSIINQLQGTNIWLRLGTSAFAIKRITNQFISSVGAPIWKPMCELADLVHGKSTDKYPIYRYLIGLSVMRNLEMAVTYNEARDKELGYTGPEEIISRLAMMLHVKSPTGNVLHDVHPDFAKAYGEYRREIAARRDDTNVRRKMTEIINLYYKGEGGDALEYGIGLDFGRDRPSK
ncbi:hypothetical protein F5Y19DRAFT_477645 [Xylariaceae sp. FL1651]|nr:hypothetical protein F5Y19DRAFT_477645 [Xylariaceae sp. FL1651]